MYTVNRNITSYNPNRYVSRIQELKIHYLMDYIPCSAERYNGFTVSSEEQAIRREVWNFKDGCCSQRIFNGLVKGVRELADGNTVVCFLPASTAEKTRCRYSRVSENLMRFTGIPCSCSAIRKNSDGLSGHIAGKQEDPASDFVFDSSFFRGKKVILIDDVVTRGNTIKGTARRILEAGASEVVGLVVARTYNPYWSGSDSRNLVRIAG